MNRHTRPITFTSRLLSTLIAFLIFVPTIASAQMFSVDESTPNNSLPGIGIYAGLGPMNFEHQGESVQGMQSDLFSFEGSVFHVKAEGRGLTFFLGAGGSTTGIDDASYFNAGLKYGYGFPIVRSKGFLVTLPVQLHSSITRVSNDQVVTPNQTEFDQGTLEFAAGLNVNGRLAPRFRISAGVTPSYGFSFATRQRDAEGKVFGLEGTARFYFDQLFGSAGLSVGYDYDFREYDINENRGLLDYQARSHSFLIGVTF